VSNHVMQVNFFNNNVRCETDGLMVSLNDLLAAGNEWRRIAGLPIKRLIDIVETKSFEAFKGAVCRRLGKTEDGIFKTVKGRSGRTMGHIYIAVYVAEQMSPDFHVEVISVFMESKLLEFREYGSTEFKNMNKAIDLYLPGREGKDSNKGIYVNAAKLLRDKILGEGACTDDWNTASVAQTHARYEAEKDISKALQRGLVRDWDHLKELIGRL
jgi:hypothetical protein